MNRRTDILDKKEQILQWIEEERPKCYIAEQLRCKQETLNHYLSLMEIEYKGQQSKKGQQKGPNKYKTAEEYINSGVQVKAPTLKRKLIREGIKECKCENCGLTKWMDEDIPLELHHKDGNHYNNDFNNLIILCPNCHALQHPHNSTTTENLKGASKTKKNECIDCGEKISDTATRCKKCSNKIKSFNNRKPRPSREELKQLIRTESFLSIGRMFNVSDNAVRKWCIAENLPKSKTEIKKISDEDWEKI